MKVLKKLLFSRPAQANYCPVSAIAFQLGVPVSVGSTLREHLQAFSLVGNSGNMVHRMAMIQLLEFDRMRSAQVNLLRLIAKHKTPQRAAEIINKNFDGVVITMSNFLRKGAIEPGMAELVENLTCEIYTVGLGLQDAMPLGDSTNVDPDMIRYLKILDDRASLFGVRGYTTEKWLRSIGFKNVTAIGCPSIFAYPANCLALRSPNRIDRVISAGHLTTSRAFDNRARKLVGGFNGVSCSYVFQGEHRNFEELLDMQGVYDEATQTISAKIMHDFFAEKTGFRLPFGKYYSFNEVAAWRQACLRYDAYVGDRIHGGVAAMQAGVPALILYADARVSELVSYHGLPSCSIDEFGDLGCRESVARHLNDETLGAFKAHYRNIGNRFVEAVIKSGLSVQTDVSRVFGT